MFCNIPARAGNRPSHAELLQPSGPVHGMTAGSLPGDLQLILPLLVPLQTLMAAVHLSA